MPCLVRCETDEWGFIRVGDELSRPCSATPAQSLYTIVARTEGYTFAAKVWALSIVQRPVSVAPCETLIVTIRNFSTLWSLTPNPTHQGDGRRGVGGEQPHCARDLIDCSSGDIPVPLQGVYVALWRLMVARRRGEDEDGLLPLRRRRHVLRRGVALLQRRPARRLL